MKRLSPIQTQVIDRHFKRSGRRSKVRVPQTRTTTSVYDASTGRLWVHTNNARKSGIQELNFESRNSICTTLVGSHELKFWDERRYATPRELARIQGFPDSFQLPPTRAHHLFSNAVAVPCAACPLPLGR